MAELSVNPQQWERGPKIVAVGGGTGLSTMLRGLKKYTKNLTAVVTVADDGGGSGMLRRDIGMPPPGDIRHCMEALANTEPIMQKLLTYRFTEGSLAGQSFGNLILAALNGVTGSFEEAVSQMSQVLAITGQVIPVTSANVQLEAVFENGVRVVGESKIYHVKKEQDCRIAHVALIPEHPAPLPAALAHPGGGPDPAGAGEPLYQRHPQSAGGRGGPGHRPVGRAENLCVQHHDPGGGVGGLHRRRPSGGPAGPRLSRPGGPVSGQLHPHAARSGGEISGGGGGPPGH